VEYAKARSKGNEAGGRINANTIRVVRKELHDTAFVTEMHWMKLSAELKVRMEREGAGL
jgi:hypothetical protein